MSARSTRWAIIAVVALQVGVLLLLPAFAGPRMPSGTEVVLRAQQGEVTSAGQPLEFDYGFGELDVPPGGEPFGNVFVELVGTRNSSEPMQLGRVVHDADELGEDATWIQLPTDDRRRIDAGPIRSHYELDGSDSPVRETLESGGSVDVRIVLDNEGLPTIEHVSVAQAG